MHSSPARTPKLQLTAEQPSTGECWIPPKKDISDPRAKVPQQDGRRGKIAFRIKPHTCQRCSEGSKKPLCTPGSRDPTETEPDLCLSLLWRYGSAVACHRGRGSGCCYLGHTDCGTSPRGGGGHQPHHRASEQTTTNCRTIIPKKFSHC